MEHIKTSFLITVYYEHNMKFTGSNLPLRINTNLAGQSVIFGSGAKLSIDQLGLAQQTEKACKQAVLGDKWYNKSCGNHPQTRQNPPIGESMSVSRARESGQRL